MCTVHSAHLTYSCYTVTPEEAVDIPHHLLGSE